MRMKKGLTLIELLVTLGVSGLVFVVVGSIIGILFTTSTRDKRLEVFEQVKNDVAAELSNTLRWGQVVDCSQMGRMSIDGGVYEVRDGRLVKGDEVLTPESVRVTNFSVVNRSRTATLASCEVVVELVLVNYDLAQDTVKIVVSQRRTESQE